MSSYANRLRRDLEELVRLTDLLHEVSGLDHDPHKLERFARETGMALLTALPDSVWKDLDAEGRRRQRAVLDHWNDLLEHL